MRSDCVSRTPATRLRQWQTTGQYELAEPLRLSRVKAPLSSVNLYVELGAQRKHMLKNRRQLGRCI